VLCRALQCRPVWVVSDPPCYVRACAWVASGIFHVLYQLQSLPVPVVPRVPPPPQHTCFTLTPPVPVAGRARGLAARRKPNPPLPALAQSVLSADVLQSPVISLCCDDRARGPAGVGIRAWVIIINFVDEKFIRSGKLFLARPGGRRLLLLDPLYSSSTAASATTTTTAACACLELPRGPGGLYRGGLWEKEQAWPLMHSPLTK